MTKKKSKNKKGSIKTKVILIVGPILLLLVIVASIIYNAILPDIKLKGGEELIINYGTKYKEKGYTASYNGKDLTDKVLVEGEVNPKKIGAYTVTYTIKYKNMTKDIQRIVVVKDIEKPKIILDNDEDIYTCPGDTYRINKYKAYDNYDKDLTKKVIVIRRNDSVTYSVSDKSGNTTSISKKVIYRDIEKPKLELNGETDKTIYLGEEYKEDGYKVIDNCDKDIKNKVEVEGIVDTNKLGSYNINYKAKDKFGNETVVKRVVNVIQKGGPGTVYLTFDDGPLAGNTDQILDILKEEGVKATFFVTSKGPDELIKREADEGHEIALHTSTHDYSYLYSSVENYFNDLTTVGDRVKKITGKEAKLIRFPGGSSNTISRRYSPGIMTILGSEVEKRGYKYCDWNIASGDAGDTTDPNEIYNNVTSRLSKDRINVVLMHDIKTYTKDALRNIIKYGKENGYSFDRLNYNQDMVHQGINN